MNSRAGLRRISISRWELIDGDRRVVIRRNGLPGNRNAFLIHCSACTGSLNAGFRKLRQAKEAAQLYINEALGNGLFPTPHPLTGGVGPTS